MNSQTCASSPSQGTILVVEDDHETRVSLRHILEYEGYSVLSQTNGRDALSLLERIPLPSMILLDRMLPLMSGDDFLKTLKSKPRYSHLPVVVISAFNHSLPREATHFLPKPLDLSQLLRTVSAFRPAIPV